MLDLNELSAVVQLLEECRHGKDGGDYEGECPICTATDKMKSAIGVPEPGAAGKELAIRDHTHQLATRLQTFRQAHWTHWSADENQLVVDAIHRLRHYANAAQLLRELYAADCEWLDAHPVHDTKKLEAAEARLDRAKKAVCEWAEQDAAGVAATAKTGGEKE